MYVCGVCKEDDGIMIVLFFIFLLFFMDGYYNGMGF